MIEPLFRTHLLTMDKVTVESGTATGGTTTTIIQTTKNWTANMWQGATVLVTIGGTEYSRTVVSNTSTTLTVAVLPSPVIAGNTYTIKQAVAVYMNLAPTGVKRPYIVQNLISKPTGVMGTTPARIQLDIYGNSFGTVKDTATMVTAAIRSFTGGFANYRANEIEQYDGEANLFRVIIDVMIYFDEVTNFG